jgi:hypothetical protein
VSWQNSARVNRHGFACYPAEVVGWSHNDNNASAPHRMLHKLVRASDIGEGYSFGNLKA